MKKTSLIWNKSIIIALIAGVLSVTLLTFGYVRGLANSIDLDYFNTLVKNNYIKEADLSDNYLYVTTIDNDKYKLPKEVVNIKELAKTTPINLKDGMSGTILSAYILAFFILFATTVFITKELTIKSIKKRVRKDENKTNPQTQMGSESLEGSFKITPMMTNSSFKDVAGVKEVKEELEEIIDFLKNPLRYRLFGVRLPKGVLLIGPPGVGKTLIAKAVAGEAKVPFFYQSGSSFVHLYVGVGAKRVKDLFAKARAYAPSIIFIDEIDAVGKARGGFRNDERESTLNQLLTEMDGFEDNNGVMVIGATNKIDMLDEALLRSGRFDRRIFIGLPSFEDRKEIFITHLSNKFYDLDIDELAKMSVGFSAAGIAALVNEAAIHALKNGADKITIENFLEVKDKVLLGKHKKMSYSDAEKKILATYQASKAIAAYWFEIDFERISLVGDNFKEIDKEIVSKTEMIAKIKVYLAGSVGVEMIYKDSFSNASEDLYKAKLIAIDMVEKYGMGDGKRGMPEAIEDILRTAKTEIYELLGNLAPSIENLANIFLRDEEISKGTIGKEINALL